jgi:hypothetical protein
MTRYRGAKQKLKEIMLTDATRAFPWRVGSWMRGSEVGHGVVATKT